jgi:hypothetical protein
VQNNWNIEKYWRTSICCIFYEKLSVCYHKIRWSPVHRSI